MCAKSISEIEVPHNEFSKNEQVCHYLKFRSDKWWHKHLEWTLYHKISLLVRGNRINKMAEAAIHISKEIAS